jgi:cobalamin-dependent methionine synthase I
VPLVTIAAARANRTPLDWNAYTPPAPKFIGRCQFKQCDLAEIAACIDWGPFFQTWDLAGPYPKIRPNRSLADYIAPKGMKPDWIGLFAVTSSLGIAKREAEFAAALDDDSSIMLKAIADRLAEAFAGRLHQRVRTEL